MGKPEISPLPSLPREALEAFLRHSVTEWKSNLRSLTYSLSKAGSKEQGPRSFPASRSELSKLVGRPPHERQTKSPDQKVLEVA